MSFYVAIAPHPRIIQSGGSWPDGLAAPQFELDDARRLPGRRGAIPRLEPQFPKPQA
jgi:hypothetical protein